jgi:hypothetical protein
MVNVANYQSGGEGSTTRSSLAMGLDDVLAKYAGWLAFKGTKGVGWRR